MIADEILGHSVPEYNSTNQGRGIMDEDTEVRRYNKARLVKGQAGMYPERRVKGWGVMEIERGTGGGKKGEEEEGRREKRKAGE
jgi:hypothetical protein